MKQVTIKIQGISPLLINKFQDNASLPKVSKKGHQTDRGTPRQQAEKTAYYDEDTKLLWVPSIWLKGAVTNISSDYRLRNSRKNSKSVIGGCFRPITEKIYFEENYKLENIEIDSRPVVIQRARVMKHRARIERWTLTFIFEIEDDIIPLEDINEMVTDAGRRSGIGDYRPSKGGPFGRFQVIEWKS